MENVVDKQDIVLYTIDDIKQIFKIGRNKALALMSSSGFPSFRINRKLYVSKNELERWITKNKGKTYNC